jgi:hypothetical protein
MILAVRMPVAVVARTLRESRSGTGVACTAERNAARAASSPCSSASLAGAVAAARSCRSGAGASSLPSSRR